MIRLDDLNTADRDGFVSALGAIYEHSPWIAERAFDHRPFADIASLHAAMKSVMEAATDDEKLALIRAHPDLAGKAARAGNLTDHSTREQAGAGLDRLTDAEYEAFHRLNDAYKAKFGMPFIIAVRDHDKASILAAFETRIDHAAGDELAEALRNIVRIAEFRLGDEVAAS